MRLIPKGGCDVLKGIPKIISPEMITVLMEMGHGDEIVIADGNFPAYTCGERIIRCDGVEITEILNSILSLFPLDVSVDKPATVMMVNEGETQPKVWTAYSDIIRDKFSEDFQFDYIDRFEFYERAKKSYAIIATTDNAFKGNVMLKKGVVR